MLSEQFGYLILLSTVVGYYFYFKDFFFGKTRPNLVSWFIWMLAPFIGVYFQLKAGAGISVLPVFIAGFGPLLVLIFSLFRKNGYWKITTFDLEEVLAPKFEAAKVSLRAIRVALMGSSKNSITLVVKSAMDSP